jgi:hypothetical protein
MGALQQHELSQPLSHMIQLQMHRAHAKTPHVIIIIIIIIIIITTCAAMDA